jgi:tetratricopeptide (TPR) repeat protein
MRHPIRFWSLGLIGTIGLQSPTLAQERSFLEWCQERDRLPEAQQVTVNALLAQVGASGGTVDCAQATPLLENYPGVLVLINQGLTDLSPLSSLPNLKGLDLSFNQVRDLKPLQGLTQLQFLLLAGNQVEDVSPLAGMTQMGYLVLDNNRIGDLSPLVTLTRLNSLQAMANPLGQKVCPVEPTTVCIFSDEGADRFAAGENFFEQGQFQAALTAFQEALEIYQDGQDEQRQGDALQRMADSALNLGQFARSLSLSEQALALRQRLQDWPGVGLRSLRSPGTI